MATKKSLQDKAILLKGKKYVLVSDRVNYFNDEVKGSITTDIVNVFDGVKGKIYVVKATITTKDGLVFTGLSQAMMGDSGANMTAALENAETSAVGRALAFMGIGVIDSIASVDEMRKAGVKDSYNSNNGVCSLCKKGALISAKGTAYCPDWQEHKANGERGTIVNATSRADDDFINSLPIEEL